MSTAMRMFVVEIGNSATSNKKTFFLRDLLEQTYGNDPDNDSDIDASVSSNYQWIFDPRPIWYDRFPALKWNFRFQIHHDDNDNGNDDDDDGTDRKNLRVTVSRTDSTAVTFARSGRGDAATGVGWDVDRLYNISQRVQSRINDGAPPGAGAGAGRRASAGRSAAGRKPPIPLRFRLYRFHNDDIHDPHSETKQLRLALKAMNHRTLNTTDLNTKNMYSYSYTYMGQPNERPPAHVKLVLIHPSVKIIRTNAFLHCRDLHVCLMPSQSAVHTIESMAFGHCHALKVVTFSPCLRNIGRMAFVNCEGLEGIFVPPTVQRIEECCFQNCERVKVLCVPRTIDATEGMGSQIMKDCNGLIKALVLNNKRRKEKEAEARRDSLRNSLRNSLSKPQAQLSSRILSIEEDEDFDFDASMPDEMGIEEDENGEIQITEHITEHFVKGWLKTRYDDYPLHKLCYDSAVSGGAGASHSREDEENENEKERTQEPPTPETEGEDEEEMDDMLMKKNDDNDSTNANGNGNILQQARQLIQSSKGKDLLISQDDQGMTPLHILCIASSVNPETYTQMWTTRKMDDDDYNEEDDKGTDSGANGNTWSCTKEDNDAEKHDREHMALLRLIFQANPTAATIKDMDGKCPIHYAASNIGFPWNEFLSLLTQDANDGMDIVARSYAHAASIPCHNGKTALHYIASNPYCSVSLTQQTRTSTPSHSHQPSHTSSFLSLYDAYPPAATMQDDDGCCPIHYAVTNECATVENFIDLLATAKEEAKEKTDGDIHSDEDDMDAIFSASHSLPAARVYNRKNESPGTIALSNPDVSLDICVYLYGLYPILRSEVRLTGNETENENGGDNETSRLDQVINAYIRRFDTSSKMLQATKLEQEGFVRHITNLYRHDDLIHLEQWMTNIEDSSKFPIGELKLIANFRGSNGRTLAEYAPPRIKQELIKRTAFLQRYELLESPPVHMTKKLLILKGLDLNEEGYYRDKYNAYVNDSTNSKEDADYIRKRGLDHHQLNELAQRIHSNKVEYSETYLKKFDQSKDQFMQCEEFVKFCKETFDQGQKRTVALKFISNKHKFEEELKIRKEFENQNEFLSTLVNIDESRPGIPDDELNEVLKLIGMEKEDVPSPSTYRNVQVTPLGDRSLDTIYRLEQPNLNQVRGYCQDIAKILKIVHDHGVCWADLNMGNVVRFNGAFKLTNLTSSVRILVGGEGSTHGNSNNNPKHREAKYYMGSSFISGVLPPEMIHSLDAGSSEETEYNAYMDYFADVREKDPKFWKQIEPRVGIDATLVVKTFLTESRTITRHGKPLPPFLAIKGEEQDLPYSPILASEAIDLWSFGSIMYSLLTAKPLFDLDRSFAFNTFESMKELATWTDDHKLNRLADDVEDVAARDLLAKLLARDPKDRGTFQEVVDHVFFKANKAGEADDDIAKALEALQKNQTTLLDNVKKVHTATREINQTIERSSQSIMKAIFEATEVKTPTCFILQPKGSDDGEGIEKDADRMGNFLGKIVSCIDAAKSFSITDIFIKGQREKYFLYLIDEYTGQTVDPPYEVTLDGEAVADYLPIMTNGWRAVKTFNSVVGLAGVFFPIMPVLMIPLQIEENLSNVINTLGTDDDLLVEASKSGEETTVRGAKLRKFEKFLIETEKEQNLNFANLRRVHDRSGNAMWVTEESYQDMKKNVEGGSAEDIIQLKAEISRNREEISRKDQEISRKNDKIFRLQELWQNENAPTENDTRGAEEDWGLGACFMGALNAITSPFMNQHNERMIKQMYPADK